MLKLLLLLLACLAAGAAVWFKGKSLTDFTDSLSKKDYWKW